jgi:3(or 17)beta-hydroxysteroid dehydrogenase
MKKLQDSVTLITGAAGGIGSAMAHRLAEEGSTIVLTDINEDKGITLANAIGKERAFFLKLDVALESDWIAAMRYIDEKFGKLNILINNASILGGQNSNELYDPENAELSTWKLMHAVNLDGTFLGCKHAITLMKTQQDSSIINICSRSGQIGVPMTAAYCSSKAAIGNLTKTVALYCAMKNYPIRCNAIYPGPILTSLWDSALGSGEERQRLIQKIAATIPLKRMGQPDDIANMVNFLVSDQASYITGTDFVIDGGISAGTAVYDMDLLKLMEGSL